MFIYKMVYAEREDFKEETYNELVRLNLIHETDYGTTEILADNVNNFLANEGIAETVIENLRNSLGEEKANALLNNEIDMVQIVY